jgi:fatty acid desaturase
VRTYYKLALGQTESYPFLNDQNASLVVRSVRLQCSIYVAAQALSFWVGRPYFVLFWLLPVALAQPLLRAILLAEHGGCSQDDDGLENTRTTYTSWPVRFLMWEMPYHAEHHLYPALPFFALARAHERIGPRLRYLAHGYLGFHVRYLKGLSKRSSPKQAA